jgi:hypothetical protein
MVNVLYRSTPMPYLGFGQDPDTGPFVYATGVSRIQGVAFLQDAMGQTIRLLPNPTGPTSDPDPAVAAYDEARLDVQYGTLPYNIEEDSAVVATSGPLQGYPDEGFGLGLVSQRYVSLFWRPTSRILSTPQGVPFWVPLPLLDPAGTPTVPMPIKNGIPTREGGGTLTVIWHRVPQAAIPFNAIANCQNKVNKDTFFGFPAQTVLLEDLDRKPIYLPNGLRAYDVQYVFKLRFNMSRGLDGQGKPNPNPPVARGWNWSLRPLRNGLDYREVGLFNVTNPGPPPVFGPMIDSLYRPADFSTLFRPDQPS